MLAHWNERTIPFPTLLVVCPSNQSIFPWLQSLPGTLLSTEPFPHMNHIVDSMQALQSYDKQDHLFVLVDGSTFDCKELWQFLKEAKGIWIVCLFKEFIEEGYSMECLKSWFDNRMEVDEIGNVDLVFKNRRGVYMKEKFVLKGTEITLCKEEEQQRPTEASPESTFNLASSGDQKQVKDSLSLPHFKAQRIEYFLDKEDDYDEDDPDADIEF